MANKFLLLLLNTLFVTICLSSASKSYFSSFIKSITLGFYTNEVVETCDDTWIGFDSNAFRKDLEESFFGQHLAATAVLKSLTGFCNNPSPKKALAISFNGITGSGKSYLASLIAKHLYRRTKSKFVHKYVANKDFPHEKKVSHYQDKLREEIPQYTQECDRSLFIFEEVEKMPPGTIDILRPFLDYYEHIDGLDYRKNIFIFISNSGSNGIVEKALEFWSEGNDREEITMNDMESLISKGAFNEKGFFAQLKKWMAELLNHFKVESSLFSGGFRHSELLSSELIDIFVPFLPMERSHVQKCVEAELRRQNLPQYSELVKEVVDSLNYFPEGTELYSTSGCKRLDNKINVYL